MLYNATFLNIKEMITNIYLSRIRSGHAAQCVQIIPSSFEAELMLHCLWFICLGRRSAVMYQKDNKLTLAMSPGSWNLGEAHYYLDLRPMTANLIWAVTP